MIDVKVHLWKPAELRAFAVFCNSVAEAKEAEPDEKDFIGGIAGAVAGWRNVAATGDDPQAEPTEEKVETAAPVPAAETAPTKRARAKKADKPAPRYFKADDDQLLMTLDGTQPAIEGIEEITKEQFEEIGARSKPQMTDSPEDQAQDAADEAAETAATKDAAKPVTIEDLRNKLGEYVKLYGMPAAMEDGPKVLQLATGDETVVKLSQVPEDKMQVVFDGIVEMIAKNPFKREAVAA